MLTVALRKYFAQNSLVAHMMRPTSKELGSAIVYDLFVIGPPTSTRRRSSSTARPRTAAGGRIARATPKIGSSRSARGPGRPKKAVTATPTPAYMDRLASADSSSSVGLDKADSNTCTPPLSGTASSPSPRATKEQRNRRDVAFGSDVTTADTGRSAPTAPLPGSQNVLYHDSADNPADNSRANFETSKDKEEVTAHTSDAHSDNPQPEFSLGVGSFCSNAADSRNCASTSLLPRNLPLPVRQKARYTRWQYSRQLLPSGPDTACEVDNDSDNGEACGTCLMQHQSEVPVAQSALSNPALQRLSHICSEKTDCTTASQDLLPSSIPSTVNPENEQCPAGPLRIFVPLERQDDFLGSEIVLQKSNTPGRCLNLMREARSVSTGNECAALSPMEASASLTLETDASLAQYKTLSAKRPTPADPTITKHEAENDASLNATARCILHLPTSYSSLQRCHSTSLPRATSSNRHSAARRESANAIGSSLRRLTAIERFPCVSSLLSDKAQQHLKVKQVVAAVMSVKNLEEYLPFDINSPPQCSSMRASVGAIERSRSQSFILALDVPAHLKEVFETSVTLFNEDASFSRCTKCRATLELRDVEDRLSFMARPITDYFWTLCWMWKTAVPAAFLANLMSFQYVNHFPNISILSRKNMLYKQVQILSSHSRLFSILPETFTLPLDLKAVTNILRNEGDPVLIVKPANLSRGRNIRLCTSEMDLLAFDRHDCIVQRYLKKPLLLNKRKCDFRVYVLLFCSKDDQAFQALVFKEGLTRVCTKPYTLDSSSLNDPLVHLTNTSINAENDGVFKRTHLLLSDGLTKLCAEYHLGYERVWSQILSVITAGLMGFTDVQNYRLSSLQSSMCFELLGADIILSHPSPGCSSVDEQNHFTVNLLEFNGSPSLAMMSDEDRAVKPQLIRKVLQIVLANELSALNEVLRELDSEFDIILPSARYSMLKSKLRTRY